MPVVRIPTVLRKHTGDAAELKLDGGTVRAVLSELVARHPALEERLFDGEQVRGFVNVYVDDEDIRYLDGLDTGVGEDSEIALMPAVAGG